MGRLLRILSSVGIGLTLFDARSLARAADRDTERARALFEEAGELERVGQWAAAEERLRAALRLRETPQLYYALGWALENEDKLLEAKVEYEAALRIGRDRPGGEEPRRLAAARLADLERKTPILKVRASEKSSARVIIDGRFVKRDDGVAIAAVNPGSHVVRVERAREGAIEHVVYVGRSTVETLDAEAFASDPVAPRDNARARHVEPQVTDAAPGEAMIQGSDRVVPLLLLGGGLVFLGSGGALLVSSSADAGIAEDGGATKEALGLAFAGTGLVSATVGAVLLLQSNTDRPNTRPTGARASVTPLPGGGFATASLAF